MAVGRVCVKELYRFMVDCFKAAGANATAAAQQAEVLTQADRMGHGAHGLNKLELCIDEILTGVCSPNNEPSIVKETLSTAVVEGNNVLGATAAHYSMNVAICKAKETGVGWVTVRGSNHFGMAGWWCLKAADRGMIGLAFTNTVPIMAPTRSNQAALGMNPIAVAAPAACGDTFYLDMCTTAISYGTLELLRGKPQTIPAGWAQQPDGKLTTDVQTALDGKCLTPLGSTEALGSYKGFGLAAMVELFCGISSGSAYGHYIRGWGKSGPANLGHCFVAIDPSCFAPGFGYRLHDCLTFWRKLQATDSSKPVLAPGDKEKQHAGIVDKVGYVKFGETLLYTAEKVAIKLKVRPMRMEMETSPQCFQ